MTRLNSIGGCQFCYCYYCCLLHFYRKLFINTFRIQDKVVDTSEIRLNVIVHSMPRCTSHSNIHNVADFASKISHTYNKYETRWQIISKIETKSELSHFYLVPIPQSIARNQTVHRISK